MQRALGRTVSTAARCSSGGGWPYRKSCSGGPVTQDQSMTSWGDRASPNARTDLDGLRNVVLPFAEQQVQAVGEFFPFGATLTTDGQIAMVAAGRARLPLSDSCRPGPGSHTCGTETSATCGR